MTYWLCRLTRVRIWIRDIVWEPESRGTSKTQGQHRYIGNLRGRLITPKVIICRYKATKATIKKEGNMPNWCNNNITIEGPKEKIKKIWDSVQADKDKGFFNHLAPMPKELEGTTSPSSATDKPQPMIDGFDNWYDWRVENWGTKWDISLDDSGLDYSEEGDTGYIKGWYDTAWGPALECFQTFIRKHNDVYVTNLYYEGGCDFAGIWTDGHDECIAPSDYKADDFLNADRDTVVGQLDECFSIGESMAEYEEEQETEAERKVRELVVEKKAQNMPEKVEA